VGWSLTCGATWFIRKGKKKGGTAKETAEQKRKCGWKDSLAILEALGRRKSEKNSHCCEHALGKATAGGGGVRGRVKGGAREREEKQKTVDIFRGEQKVQGDQSLKQVQSRENTA